MDPVERARCRAPPAGSPDRPARPAGDAAAASSAQRDWSARASRRLPAHAAAPHEAGAPCPPRRSHPRRRRLAPISSAQARVTGAPPTITLTPGPQAGRRQGASTTARWPGHRGRQERRDADDGRRRTAAALAANAAGAHVDAQVVDLEPVRRQERGRQVLADLVDVPGDRSRAPPGPPTTRRSPPAPSAGSITRIAACIAPVPPASGPAGRGPRSRTPPRPRAAPASPPRRSAGAAGSRPLGDLAGGRLRRRPARRPSTARRSIANLVSSMRPPLRRRRAAPAHHSPRPGGRGPTTAGGVASEAGPGCGAGHDLAELGRCRLGQRRRDRAAGEDRVDPVGGATTGRLPPAAAHAPRERRSSSPGTIASVVRQRVVGLQERPLGPSASTRSSAKPPPRRPPARSPPASSATSSSHTPAAPGNRQPRLQVAAVVGHLARRRAHPGR